MTVRAHVVFTAGKGFSGWITRWYEFDEVGHVAMELPNGMILDSVPSAGVSYHEGLCGEVIYRFVVDCPEATEHVAIEWMMSQVGKPYDWLALAGMAFRRDWRNDSAWYCADLVLRGYEIAGFPLLRLEHYNRVTPRDLRMSPCLHPA
jgi:uncharacterized protein YycO